MERDFEDFIVTRCERAKLEDDEYLEKERGSSEPEEVQGMAEIVCYKKGFSDAMAIIQCSQKM